MVPVLPLDLRVPWRAWLILIHRWLGIAGCLLFIAWFISGVVMMYARMPSVTTAERLQHAPSIDAGTIAVAPPAAAARAGAPLAAGLQVATLGGRPVYRFPGAPAKTVFADSGEVFVGMDAEQAVAIAAAWAPDHRATVHYAERVSVPDQWTLQTRQHLPLHRVAIGDAADTQLYVSNVTGEVVMETARWERFWAYWGPVTHWLYMPLLRRNGPLWTQVIIWSSAIGCVMCVVGLAVGLLRYSPRGRFRLRDGQSHTPYAGTMRWHHYAGLLFGAITLTWTFSGLLSMGPFSWLSNGRVTSDKLLAVQGVAPALDGLTVDAVRAAIRGIAHDFAPKELTLTQFRGEAFWMSESAPRDPEAGGRTRTAAAATRRVLVSAMHPETGPFRRFDDGAMERAAHEAMPGSAIADMAWLDEYDAYYYDRQGTRPLPVLRVRYADADRTWLYLDPQRGSIALMSRPRGRLNRWLYHGLHSLDFPALYYRRPLWDGVVILLSLGGVALGITSVTPAWRRLRRHVRRFVVRVRGAGATRTAGTTGTTGTTGATGATGTAGTLRVRDGDGAELARAHGLPGAGKGVAQSGLGL